MMKLKVGDCKLNQILDAIHNYEVMMAEMKSLRTVCEMNGNSVQQMQEKIEKQEKQIIKIKQTEQERYL